MKRMVAYIYRYEKNGKGFSKCANMGFCRVEQNSDKCTVMLSLKDNCGVEGAANISVLNRDVKVTGENTYVKQKLNRCHRLCNGVLNVKLDMNCSDGVCVECCGRVYIGLWIHSSDSVNLVEKTEEKREIKEEKQENREENNSNKNKCTKDNNKEKGRRESCMEDYTRIYNRLCKVRMVLNGAEFPAVKIKPHELIMLPRQCWRMANNIFLMESYYRYGHILFMQYEGKYILAVPWQNTRGVEKKAKQCGFLECVSGYEFGRENQEKLYWIKYL